MSKHQAFLKSVKSFNGKFNAVRAKSKVIPLPHPFWSEAAIRKSSKIKEDWGVPLAAVPFYGDWHTVICLNENDGSIEMLNGDRRHLFRWKSADEFQKCLTLEPESPTDTDDIIEEESHLGF